MSIKRYLLLKFVQVGIALLFILLAKHVSHQFQIELLRQLISTGGLILLLGGVLPIAACSHLKESSYKHTFLAAFFVGIPYTALHLFHYVHSGIINHEGGQLTLLRFIALLLLVAFNSMLSQRIGLTALKKLLPDKY